ncbi:poly [ADP-ribose] polymerase 12-like protein [Labeo rohita]|uniref:Poly [ADP-ribose] polymerase n=2 Tax=Labeo rohita TaxID=84645 RepID=A0A498LIG4_LABRO|nr:protein mono-ADP-ribosyltransferase PARP12-like isoform X1 [Labeo rohita]RXN08118.1 poly [ADP-ribose] polymerase 12-like protein [Labeo rohita]RXN27225.1 poly [ADP-ribose] polymerase 12-like protein [Labeo rohita]
MAEEILKVLCGNHGSMDYERLLDISYGLKEITAENSLDKIIRHSDIFTVIERDESREVFAQTTVKLCRKSDCDELCEDIHLCKYELMMGRCSRHSCNYGHQLMSEHNVRVLRAHQMIGLSREDLLVMLLQSDSGLLPPVCYTYNRGQGPHGNCQDGEKCSRLHLCESFIRGCCGDTDCGRSHDFQDPNVRKILRFRGVSNQLMHSLPFIYRNILTLKTLKTQRDRRNTDVQPHSSSDGENEICLSFVRGFCRADKCSKTHCKMPYKWEVKVGRKWHNLPNSEQIERDYCDPSNIHSSGNEPICFEEMSLGLDEVRRLSTQPSVLLPGLALTTSWSWYWKDEYNRWIQYASIAEMHRLCSVSSEQLERRYQEYLRQDQEDAGIKFTAGNRFYELRFRDMKQRNEVSGKERPVRRRPVFVSSVDVQIARSRCCGTHKTRFYKGVPGFWDQTAIPDSGFRRVRLPPSHRDYMRVRERFTETLSGFTIRQIERVQNRELWEEFMIKKEQMKITNKQEKYGDRLLFHATKSSLVDAVCQRNFNFEESDTAAYGQGIYFSKDARYWNEWADGSALRLMFACRVLVGYYTRGAAHFRHPPAKNAEGKLYDSCVDDKRDPSVFVVFDRCQIYPEFLITYEDSNKRLPVLEFGVPRVDAKTVVFTNSSRCTSSVSSLEDPDSDPEHTSYSCKRKEPLITVLSSTALPVSSSALPVSAESASKSHPVSAKSVSTELAVSAIKIPVSIPVSAERMSTAFPVSTESASKSLPVSTERVSTVLSVSGKDISTAHPVSAKSVSSALPVSTENALNALPVSTKHIFTAHPVSAKSVSTPLPVSTESVSTALPVSTERISTSHPVSVKSVSTPLPVPTERISTACPVSAKSVSTALPVPTEHTSTALPVSTERTSTARPVSSKSASNALPVSTERISTPLPVSYGPRMAVNPLLEAQKLDRSPSQRSVTLLSSEATAVKYSVNTADLNMNRTPVCPAQGLSRSSGSMSSSSAISSHQRVLPRDHTGNSSAADVHSSAGTNPHKPAEQKKNCAVM